MLEKLKNLPILQKLIIYIAIISTWFFISNWYNGRIEEPIAKAENLQTLWYLSVLVIVVFGVMIFAKEREGI